MRQEALIGMYEALKADPDGTDRYLVTRAKWNQLKYLRKGRSVDNGFYKRDELTLVHYDQLPAFDSVFAQVISLNGTAQLDEQVLDKICLERLLDDLSGPELEVFGYKVIDELYDIQIRKKLRIGNGRLEEIKAGIRYKIREAFGD